MAVEFQYAPGATPLDPDEAAGLVPKHITNQGDLNTWEQANIFQATRWAAKQTKRDLLAMRLGSSRLSWGGGSGSLISVGDLRTRYLSALRAADQGQYADLIAFASS
jgi:hypothetical protein